MRGVGQGNRSRGGNAPATTGYDNHIPFVDRIPCRSRCGREIDKSESGSPIGRKTGLQLPFDEEFPGNGSRGCS